MRAEVCYALPDGATRITVVLVPGATVADALRASDIEHRLGIDARRHGVAIFGRRASFETPLHEGDRVEILRPLTIDPMEARRLRARKATGSPDV